jgi:putative oxidoreductase
MKSGFDLAGRILIGLVSIFEALDSIVFFKETKQTMNVYNLDYALNVILIVSIVFLLLGGIMVLIGYNARIGALLLLLYWLPYTCIVYSFWNDNPEVVRVQALMFLRSLGYCGGLCILIANGAGNLSVKRLFHVMRLPG